MKFYLYLALFSATGGELRTLAAPVCTGRRPGCGGVDALTCSQQDGCRFVYDLVTGNNRGECLGHMPPCEMYNTAASCVNKVGCSWGDGPPIMNIAGGKDIGAYYGTAKTSLWYYRPNFYTGQVELFRQIAKEYPVAFYLSTPYQEGSTTESNPFHFNAGPRTDGIKTGGEGHDEGYINIVSASIINAYESGRNTLLQYWNVRLDGERIHGNMVDNHVQSASNMNWIYAYQDMAAGLWMVTPHPMAAGATMEGTLSKTGLRLTIEGQSTDASVVFSSEIVASATDQQAVQQGIVPPASPYNEVDQEKSGADWNSWGWQDDQAGQQGNEKDQDWGSWGWQDEEDQDWGSWGWQDEEDQDWGSWGWQEDDQAVQQGIVPPSSPNNEEIQYAIAPSDETNELEPDGEEDEELASSNETENEVASDDGKSEVTLSNEENQLEPGGEEDEFTTTENVTFTPRIAPNHNVNEPMDLSFDDSGDMSYGLSMHIYAWGMLEVALVAIFM